MFLSPKNLPKYPQTLPKHPPKTHPNPGQDLGQKSGPKIDQQSEVYAHIEVLVNFCVFSNILVLIFVVFLRFDL